MNTVNGNATNRTSASDRSGMVRSSRVRAIANNAGRDRRVPHTAETFDEGVRLAPTGLPRAAFHRSLTELDEE